jgi:hypothetical protein
VRAPVRAGALALLLAASVALTGCGPGRQAPAQRSPDRISPADVQQREAEVDDLERVVGSAEAETANDG